MKKILAMVLAIGISAMFGLAAAQAKPSKRCDLRTHSCRLLTFRDLRQGYHLFRHTCKTCHHHHDRQGAGFLYTGSFSMEGWNQIFASRYPKCARDGSWNKFSQEQLEKVNDYLFANAWDANNPHVML